MTGLGHFSRRLPHIRVYDPVGTACAWVYAMGSVTVLGLLGHMVTTEHDHHEPAPPPSQTVPDVSPQN